MTGIRSFSSLRLPAALDRAGVFALLALFALFALFKLSRRSRRMGSAPKGPAL
jgi:hypothetical protein